MNTTITLNRSLYLFGFLFLTLIFVVSFGVSYSTLIITYPELAIGITFDLAFTAPLLYLILIWKTRIPKTTVVPFFVVGITIATFIVPAEQQIYLSLIKTWILPILEVGLIGFIGYSVYKTVKTYRTEKDKNSDLLKILEETTERVVGIPALNKAVAFEIAVLYYAFISWRQPKPTGKTFTYHKKSGKITLYSAIIFIIGIETVVLHIVVSRWNEIIAWILTVSSAYVLLQILAHLKAVYQRPLEIIENRLLVKYGLFRGSEIELDNIEKVESSFQMPEYKKGLKQVALLGELEQFNTRIHLRKESDFYGLYGKKNKYKTLLLFVDEQDDFIKLITKQ